MRSGSSSCFSSQSTPSALATSPSATARDSPGLSGSTPIIQRGSITSDRSSLYIRSVPMLPGPTMAAVFLVICFPSGSGGFETLAGARSSTTERQVDRAEVGEVGDELVARSYVDRAVHGAGQDHVARLERDAEGRDLVGEPGHGGDRVAEHGV